MNGSVTEQGGTPDVCTDVLRRRVGVATSDAVAVVYDFPEMSTTVQHHCEACALTCAHIISIYSVSVVSMTEKTEVALGAGALAWACAQQAEISAKTRPISTQSEAKRFASTSW